MMISIDVLLGKEQNENVILHFVLIVVICIANFLLYIHLDLTLFR